MTENAQVQPDIEIYVKRISIDDILAWIGFNFSIDEQKTVGSALKLTLTRNETSLSCTIVENVAKGPTKPVHRKPSITSRSRSGAA